MKLKIVVVDFEIPRKTKRWLLRLGIPLVVVGAAGIALAAPSLKVWSQGDTLTADDLNNNFNAPPSVSTALNTGSTAGTGAFKDGLYTTPPGVRWLEIELVGAGGGGGPSGGTDGTKGGAGGKTTFGGSLLVANGGGGGTNSYAGLPGTAEVGAGGTAIVAVSAAILPIKVLSGGNGVTAANIYGTYQMGGAGGVNALGGGGSGIVAANTGSGGCGAYVQNKEAIGGPYTGHGGGAGGYIHAIVIPTPGQTFAYSVGTPGAGGVAGTNGYAGQPGSSGAIFVREHYL